MRRPNYDYWPEWPRGTSTLTEIERDALYREMYPEGLAVAKRRHLKQHLRDIFEEQLFSQHRGRILNERVMIELASEVDRYLRDLQEDGHIPEYIDIKVTVSKEWTAVQVDLPWFLRVWLDEGEAMRTPEFEHSCKSCTFLAHHGEHDYYVCESGHAWPTVIARYGNNGQDCQSGLEVARHAPEDHPLKLALRLAEEKGLLRS